ncbi:cytochrome c biogenesis protein CcsA [Tibeticola sp.]|uniref:cytochrome C assembly family protein n=1 Tax=Tibeticola sp. TaxID=2005368 RepID=UPI0025DFA93E|nr:cytochrome c biogenesis protein CcsA [Tibeticola sp.]
MILSSPPLPSVWLSAAAALVYAVTALGAERLSLPRARALLLLAWVLHACTLALGLLETPARFGFAPALSMTAWLVLTVYAVESQVYPQLRARWPLAGLGTLAVLLPLAFPGAPLHPSASAWLPLHLALGLASYGLFGAAVVHAALMTRAERLMREGAGASVGLPLLTLERLTFRFVQAGFVLLTATLIAGLFFGEQLYGASLARWKWDHKTIFSLLAWLTFAVLLAGRARLGWRGRRAVRVLYIGAGLLLLAYAGSRFVLEVVLGRAP